MRAVPALLMLIISLVYGCAAPIDAENAEDGGWRFGLTRISKKPTDDRVVAQELSTFGIWRQPETAGLGFSRTSELYVPLDCHLVILVTNEEQLRSVEALVKDFSRDSKETICIGKE